MVWLFGVYCVRWIALFSLGVESRNLILPQFDVLALLIPMGGLSHMNGDRVEEWIGAGG